MSSRLKALTSAVAMTTSILVLNRTEGVTEHTQTSGPHNFLSTVAGFTETDLAAVDQGSVVVKVVRTPNDSEVALIGPSSGLPRSFS